MATSFMENDSLSACDSLQTKPTRQAVAGGVAGSSSTSSGSISGLAVQEPHITFSIVGADAYNGATGNYTVRLNVTTAGATITWTYCEIFVFNAACAQGASLGVVTSPTLSISCSTTGVKSITFNGSAWSPVGGDTLGIVLGFDNGSGSPASFSFTPNQNIDTPMTLVPVTVYDASMKRVYYNALVRM